MGLKYIYKEETGNTARAYGRNLSISTKQSVEICNNIRGIALDKAKEFLLGVINKKMPVKMSKYIKDLPHKKNIGPGRYPVKAAKAILIMLKSAEANALNKGLSRNLVIRHISAHKASTPYHYGRKRRVRMKRTNIQVVLEEQGVKKSQNISGEGKEKPLNKSENKKSIGNKTDVINKPSKSPAKKEPKKELSKKND